MSKRSPLQPIVDIAKNNTADATKKLGLLNQHNLEMKAKLDLLLQYKGEYQNRMMDATKNGLSPAQWRNYQDFLQKIDDAIEQQKQVIAGSQRNLEAGQLNYMQQRKKLKSFETLLERHYILQAHKESKKEQKEQDEMASNTFNLKNKGGE